MASFPQYLLVCALFVAVFICQACKLILIILIFLYQYFLYDYVTKILNATLYTTDGGVPFVIGHRGASSELPENTLPAFARALGYGVAGIETDLRLTKDGVIVLFHDEVTGLVPFPSFSSPRILKPSEIIALYGFFFVDRG